MTQAENTTYSYLMVGGGQLTDEWCGNYTSWADVCPTRLENHLHDRFKYNCKMVTCPSCYPKKLFQLANFNNQRLIDTRKTFYLNGIRLDRGDIVLSPPASQYHLFNTEKGRATLRKTALDIAEQAGGVGGCLTLHQYRGRKILMDQIRQGKATPPASWHFHYESLRLRRWVKSNEVQAATGWIYKWTPEEHYKKPKNGLPRNLNHLLYELDHAAVPIKASGKAGQIIVPYGIISRRNISQLKTIIQELKCCEVCGRPGERVFEDEVRGEATRKRVQLQHTITAQAIERAITRYNMPQGAPRAEDLKDLLNEARKKPIRA